MGTKNITQLWDSIIFYYPCSESSHCGPISIYLSSGKYLLEVWGGRGGDNMDGKLGGSGGFSSGILSVPGYTTLFLYIGGKGEVTNSGSARGGYNGGGSGNMTSTNLFHGGGGGSTDFRATTSVYSRILVAGGGGGAGWRGTEDTSGGYGGGTSAGDGNSDYGWYGHGATSSSHGLRGCNDFSECGSSGDFFYGGNGSHGANSPGGGGGSGYYGGGGGHCAGGGGGSGYYGSLKNGKTISGNKEFLSPSGESEFGHYENGAAKISIIGMYSDTYHLNCPIYHILLLSHTFLFLGTLVN